ncbi:hypothetical protein BJ912DRAFT_1057349 [Pholiota molesta]|nr:hypothetical protein BJ912DRAFT_1057349 [Pholiota molesta]
MRVWKQTRKGTEPRKPNPRTDSARDILRVITSSLQFLQCCTPAALSSLSPTSGPPHSLVQPASCLRGFHGGAAEPRIIPSFLVPSPTTKYGSHRSSSESSHSPCNDSESYRRDCAPTVSCSTSLATQRRCPASIRSPCSLRHASHRRMEEWTILELDVALARWLAFHLAIYPGIF